MAVVFEYWGAHELFARLSCILMHTGVCSS